MDDAQRWSVTYTKHVKQKRKVYHDGLLELQFSRRKVILYDEEDKLLESRFVKKDDVLKSGETLAFDSYLVDIGELRGGHKPTSTVTYQEKDSTVTEKPQSSHSDDCQRRKPTFGKVKGRKLNLSPSQKVIREFRGRELNKYASSPSSVDVNKSSTTEWQVLYTTQITQKAKKFHDGFLQLTVRGSLGRQVMLYDITRRILESRFLKKHEIVCSGESLAFEGHVVEIGEQEGDQKAETDSTIQGKDCQTIGKTCLANYQAKISTSKTPVKPSPKKLINFNNSSSVAENANLSWGTNANEPKRAVHDILSILRKPILIKDATMNKTSLAVQHESHTKEFDGNAEEEQSENNSDHSCRIKILKPKTEVLSTAEKCTVYENGIESQARSSSFCLSSSSITPILTVECIDRRKLVATSSVEPHSLVYAEQDSENQKPNEPAAFPRSNKVVEPEKHPETSCCEEIITETKAKAASTVGLSSSKFPKDHAKEMGEFPSFDLGF